MNGKWYVVRWENGSRAGCFDTVADAERFAVSWRRVPGETVEPQAWKVEPIESIPGRYDINWVANSHISWDK